MRDAGFVGGGAYLLLLWLCHSYNHEPCRRDVGVDGLALWLRARTTTTHYCRVTLIDRWNAFCGINESGMFAGFEQFGVLAFAVLFVRATFPLAPDVDVSTAGLLRVLCT